MDITEEDYLSHYGILRRSGRYPWGSGDNAYQRAGGLISYVDELRGQGLTEREIATGVGMSVGELRNAKSVAKNEIKAQRIAEAERYRNKGMSYTAISDRMDIPESSVRALLKQDNKDKAQVLDNVTEVLRKNVDEKRYVDIGKGVEHQLDISKGKLDKAVAKLKELGYRVFYVKETQLGTGNETSIRVLAKPDVEYAEVAKNKADIKQIIERSEDGGRSMLGIYDPVSISSKRLAVNYAEDGGEQADGVIYVRPGVKDLSLGGASYAQVRIAIDGTHYAKGMAIYKDDLPEGVDLVFNTNKSVLDAPNKLDTLKKMKRLDDGSIDKDNPFGSAIKRQITRTKRDGTVVAESAMNIVNEEGDWGNWSKTLSSQVLSKQSETLAKAQLQKAYDQRLRDLESIESLTNPVVKKRLLDNFGDEADSAAVHLKAAALGQRQASQVILPINSMKDTEVYAPNFNDGEKVVLIRYPHAGKFEIPELTVNNRQPEARKLLGNARDAVGINHKVAEQLSGADFDGDTVLVIPNNQGRIKTAKALAQLKGFDPKAEYKYYDGMKVMTAREKGRQMGEVSNLITDMTIKGASPSEIASAVKHSMVVIDAEKHSLNWRLSEEQNGIKNLKAKYQAGGGASTIISRAKGRHDIPERRARRASEGGPVDPKTGKKVFVETGATYTDKRTGKTKKRMQTVERLSVYDDAHDLVSSPNGTNMERIYADHSNRLKALGNRARKTSLETPKLEKSSSAEKVYAKEVESLNSKLAIAQRNAPYERQAQLIGNATYKRKLAQNPDMDAPTRKKVKAQALQEARSRVGAGKKPVVIEPLEWEAIQAGAVSHSKLEDILDNADMDRVKELATPKPKLKLTSAKQARAQAMLRGGATRAEVARALGVSLTTLDEYTDAQGGRFLDE